MIPIDSLLMKASTEVFPAALLCPYISVMVLAAVPLRY